jgi:hypothetical protein
MAEKHVVPTTGNEPGLRRINALVLTGAALVVFSMFAFWGGVPTGQRAVTFWIGVELLLALLLGFGWLGWHLLWRPLPVGQTVQLQSVKASYRHAMSLLLSMGGCTFIVGAFWDEIWHRQYGIPFGEDFFWRPHLLLYFGIVVAIALAVTGLYIIIRSGQGTFQQRFRANPMIGLLVLVGGFLMVVLPADPIWHGIYGEDLTAWSLPHVLLFISFNSILLVAIAIHMTTEPQRSWGAPGQLSLIDAQPLVLFAAMSLSWNQFFTTEWDGGARFVLARPEWLLPVMIVTGAAFIGVLANHTLRVFGAATLTGVLALMLRFALIQLFDAEAMMRFHAWVLMLPSLVLIDIWYVFRRGTWIGAGIAAAVGMAVMLVTVFARFYPLYPITNLPIAFLMVLGGALGLSDIGAALGDYFATANKQVERTSMTLRAPLVSLAVAVVLVGFIIFFVTTATPPV